MAHLGGDVTRRHRIRQGALVLVLLALVVAGRDAARAEGGRAASRGSAVPVPSFTPALRTLARRDDISFGAAVDTGALRGDPAYATELADQYDMVTAENAMKWAYTEPQPGRFDFTAADRLVTFAEAHGMQVRGHTLVWFEENPTWVSASGMTGAKLAGALRQHIVTEVSHFRGRIAQWDVVNEAVGDDGRLRDDLWLQRLGPSYIADAFRWAHEADPHAVLFYNDYGIEAPGPKADAVYRLLAGLKAQGVPIGGIGFQVHLTNPATFDPEALAAEMARFAGLGLQTAVTEMDVRLQLPAGPTALKEQAVDFAGALAACRSESSCHTFVTWGFTDLDSWIPGTFPGYGQALPFDRDLRPKPAAYSLRSVLEASAISHMAWLCPKGEDYASCSRGERPGPPAGTSWSMASPRSTRAASKPTTT